MKQVNDRLLTVGAIGGVCLATISFTALFIYEIEAVELLFFGLTWSLLFSSSLALFAIGFIGGGRKFNRRSGLITGALAIFFWTLTRIIAVIVIWRLIRGGLMYLVVGTLFYVAVGLYAGLMISSLVYFLKSPRGRLGFAGGLLMLLSTVLIWLLAMLQVAMDVFTSRLLIGLLGFLMAAGVLWMSCSLFVQSRITPTVGAQEG